MMWLAPNRCCDQGHFEQAVGIAIEARRLDKLEEVIRRAPDRCGCAAAMIPAEAADKTNRSTG